MRKLIAKLFHKRKSQNEFAKQIANEELAWLTEHTDEISNRISKMNSKSGCFI